ncbi:hypothetical protein KY49_3545 [Burkholderia sp. MSHR3999]|nr:hypothetical protein KY49_3545 [Burkholderia sp. MSHR3999]
MQRGWYRNRMKFITVMPCLAMWCSSYAFASSLMQTFERIKASLSTGTFMQHAHAYMNADRAFWLSA